MGRPRRIETPVEKARRIRDLILIRAGRTALGLSQRDLVRLVNLHYSALARFESGNLRLKSDHIQRILDYFQKAGISHQDTDQGDLLIHISGEGLNHLAKIDYAHDENDLTPRFRL
jgi:transcriptional regulator with XRE-family HTH domain